MHSLLLSALLVALVSLAAAQMPQFNSFLGRNAVDMPPTPAPYLPGITIDAVGLCKYVKCGPHDKCSVVDPPKHSSVFRVECVPAAGK